MIYTLLIEFIHFFVESKKNINLLSKKDGVFIRVTLFNQCINC